MSTFPVARPVTETAIHAFVAWQRAAEAGDPDAIMLERAERRLIEAMDAGHGSVHQLVVYRPDEEASVRSAIGDRAAWEWDSDEDLPTLSPSIGCGPKNDRDWHGHLGAGRLVACE